jgi:holo-[acyl-carrier protein] synthase
MIIGNGIDLVEIERINSIYKKFQESFIKKYFLNDKIEKLEVRALANNFAIKEAFSKSLGLGFRDPCYPNSISVNRDDLGKPFIIPKSKLKKYLIEKYGNFVIHVSLSDTKKYSIASVILEQT